MWLTTQNHKISAPDLAPPDGMWYKVVKVLRMRDNKDLPSTIERLESQKNRFSRYSYMLKY